MVVLPAALSSPLAYYAAGRQLRWLRSRRCVESHSLLSASRYALRVTATYAPTQLASIRNVRAGLRSASVDSSQELQGRCTRFTGSVFPRTLSIPCLSTPDHGAAGWYPNAIGPIVGALAYHALSTELTRLTDHWRLFLGLAIVILAVVFPDGIVGFARRRFAKTQ